jgi:hypothetical protein
MPACLPVFVVFSLPSLWRSSAALPCHPTTPKKGTGQGAHTATRTKACRRPMNCFANAQRTLAGTFGLRLKKKRPRAIAFPLFSLMQLRGFALFHRMCIPLRGRLFGTSFAWCVEIARTLYTASSAFGPYLCAPAGVAVPAGLRHGQGFAL